MKYVKVRFRENVPETTLALPMTTPMTLCHTSMCVAEDLFARTHDQYKASKLFVQQDAMTNFGRYDFLPDVTSHSPYMRLPHILGSIFGLYVIPMPQKCIDDFEWIVTDEYVTWGVASAKAD